MSEPVNEQDRCDVGPPDEHLRELIKHSKQLEEIIGHLKRLEALCVTMVEDRCDDGPWRDSDD